MRSSSSPRTVPSMPTTSRASSRPMPPAYTRLPSMSGWNRAPSSSVKKATAKGCSVVIPLNSRVSITSRPASTPRLPSKRPPVRTVSIWLPVMIGAPSVRPGRTPTTLPMPSMLMSRPRSVIQATTRSRPSLSSSVRARRQEPPPSIGPMVARSLMRRTSRSPSMCRSLTDRLPPMLRPGQCRPGVPAHGPAPGPWRGAGHRPPRRSRRCRAAPRFPWPRRVPPARAVL